MPLKFDAVYHWRLSCWVYCDEKKNHYPITEFYFFNKKLATFTTPIKINERFSFLKLKIYELEENR